jgi:hypothetical protein
LVSKEKETVAEEKVKAGVRAESGRELGPLRSASSSHGSSIQATLDGKCATKTLKVEGATRHRH